MVSTSSKEFLDIQANYRAWIYSETCMWHDNNTQTNGPYRYILTAQLNHLTNLAKWLSVHLRTKWLWVQITLAPLKLPIWHLLWARSSLPFRQTIEFGFTLKLIHDMIITYSQMHRTDKYSEHSLIIWPVSLNGWVFVLELSGCGFESRCCHLNFRYGSCFKEGVSWHSGKRWVWIHSDMTLTHSDMKLDHDMIITYSKMHLTDKYSQHSWIIWPV